AGERETARIERLRHELSIAREQQVPITRVRGIRCEMIDEKLALLRVERADEEVVEFWLAAVREEQKVIPIRQELGPQLASFAGTIDGRDRRRRSTGRRHARQPALARRREDDDACAVPRAASSSGSIAHDLQRSACHADPLEAAL